MGKFRQPVKCGQTALTEQKKKGSFVVIGGEAAVTLWPKELKLPVGGMHTRGSNHGVGEKNLSLIKPTHHNGNARNGCTELKRAK